MLALWTYTTLNNTSLDLDVGNNNKQRRGMSGFDAIIRLIRQ